MQKQKSKISVFMSMCVHVHASMHVCVYVYIYFNRGMYLRQENLQESSIMSIDHCYGLGMKMNDSCLMNSFGLSGFHFLMWDSILYAVSSIG